MYKNVRNILPTLTTNLPVRKTRSSNLNHTAPKKAIVNCDECHFKSSFVQMKMHIKNIHMKKATKASKRLPVFTPVVKASKRNKPEPISSPSNVKMMNISNLDDSILLLPDEPALFDVTNLEEIVIDSIRTEDSLPSNSMEETTFRSQQNSEDKHVDNVSEPVAVKINCCVCEYEASGPNLISDHEITQHGMVKCCKCDTTIYESLLRNHMMENHSEKPAGGDETVFDKAEGAIDSYKPAEDAPSFICGQCELSFAVEVTCPRSFEVVKVR